MTKEETTTKKVPQNAEPIDYQAIYLDTWNQYSIYYLSHNAHVSFFNTLGAVATIFIFILSTLAIEKSWLFCIPLPFFLVPLIYAVTSIQRSKSIRIPWIDKKRAEKQFNEGKQRFFEKRIDEIHTVANTLYEYREFARKGTYNSILWMAIGVGATVMILFLRLMPP